MALMVFSLNRHLTSEVQLSQIVQIPLTSLKFEIDTQNSSNMLKGDASSKAYRFWYLC